MNEQDIQRLQEMQGAQGGFGAADIAVLAVVLLVGLVTIAGMWKTFAKAGEPGWAAIIPIYNYVVLVKISGKPMWWVVLFFIPCANIVAAILVPIAIAERFGKGAGFGIGLAFLSFIFFPLLGFGDAQYSPPPRT
jgi:hypothetical protein